MSAPDVDVGFGDAHGALRARVDEILGDVASDGRTPPRDERSAWLDRDAWQALAAAGALRAGLPAEVGGGGGSFVDTAITLEAIGRHRATVPVLASIVGGAMPIARHGDAAQRDRWAARAAIGETILTAALHEPDNDDVTTPSTSADLGIDGWRITGTKHCVPAAHLAERVLVPARAGVGTGVFLADPGHDSVTRTPFTAINGEPLSRLHFDHTPAEPLGDPVAGRALVASMHQHLICGLCIVQAGVCDAARRAVARHLGTTEPVPGIARRAADVYVDTETVRLTAWDAAWRLAEGMPAAAAVATAKYWAATAGTRAARTAHQLCDEVGADIDDAGVHWTAWTQLHASSLGGASHQLRVLGARITAS